MLRWEPPGYRLDIPADDVDFRRFERLADEGRVLLADGHPGEAAARLREALELWRGPALLECANEEFARGLATRLEERRLAALEDRIEADLALGRHAALVGELTELVGRNPLRETLWAQLALALYRAGRQADALRALDDMRTTLRDDLGVDPSRPLRTLEARILDQDPGLDATLAAPAASALPASAPAAGRAETGPQSVLAVDIADGVGATGIVGRRAEVLEMIAAYNEMVRANARFAIVEGEPGIGKTRLLEELSREADRAGAAVYWGRCHEGGAAPAFWPWLEVLRALVERGDGASVIDEQLATVLAPAAALAEPPGADRFRLFEAVAQALDDAAARAPVAIVLDDVQWADPASLELLEFLAGRLSTVRVIVAVSVRELERTAAVVDALAALTRRPGTRRLQLRGLDEQETGVLVGRATGAAPSSAVVRAIHARADGNPFFVGELARLVVADVAGSDEELIERAGVPAGVRDVVRRRLARLPEGTRDLLQAAAVIGRETALELLRRVADRDVEQCLDDLEHAIATGLIIEVPDAPATFRFAHALVREVVLEELATLRRARLHLRAADAIVAAGGDTDDNAEIIAAHLWDAVSLGDRERAASALERAAAVAMRRFAYESAEPLLERALQLRHGAGDDPAALSAEFHAIAALARVRRARYGYVTTATTTPLDRARELAERTGRFDLLYELMWEEWAAAATACELEPAGRLAAQMLEISKRSDDPLLRALGHSAWGVHCWHTGRLTEAAGYIDAAVALDASIDPRLLGEGAFAEQRLLAAGFHVVIHDYVDVENDGEARALALLERVSDPYPQVVLLELAGFGGIIAHDPARAARIARRGLVLDPTCAFIFFTSACGLSLAWALSELGDNDEALALFDAYLPRYRSTGVRTTVALFLANYALTLMRAGRTEDAHARLAEATEVLETFGERWQEPLLLERRAEIAVLEGASEQEVDELFRRAVETATAQGSLAVAHHVEAAWERAARGRPSEPVAG